MSPASASLEGFGFVSTSACDTNASSIVDRVMLRCREMAEGRRRPNTGIPPSDPSLLVLTWLKALDRNSLRSLVGRVEVVTDSSSSSSSARPACRLEADLMRRRKQPDRFAVRNVQASA